MSKDLKNNGDTLNMGYAQSEEGVATETTIRKMGLRKMGPVEEEFRTLLMGHLRLRKVGPVEKAFEVKEKEIWLIRRGDAGDGFFAYPSLGDSEEDIKTLIETCVNEGEDYWITETVKKGATI